MGRQVDYLRAVSRKDDPVSRVWAGYYMTWGHPGMVRTQAVVRGFLVRKHMKKVKRGRLVSGVAREESAARCIQRHWRGWQQRVAYLDLYLEVVPPVVTIQRVARGWLARRLYRKLRARKRRLDPYATAIQRCYRGRLGRRVALDRRIELLERRRELVRRRFVAIVVAQKCARRWLANTRAATLRLLRRSAAVTLQRHFRGWTTRRMAAALRDEKTRASTTVQRYARGWMARRKVQKLRRQREHTRMECAAATAIQRVARGWLARTAKKRTPPLVTIYHDAAVTVDSVSPDSDRRPPSSTSGVFVDKDSGSIGPGKFRRSLAPSPSLGSAASSPLSFRHSGSRSWRSGLNTPVLGGASMPIPQQRRPPPPTPPSSSAPHPLRSLSMSSSSSSSGRRAGLASFDASENSVRRSDSSASALPSIITATHRLPISCSSPSNLVDRKDVAIETNNNAATILSGSNDYDPRRTGGQRDNNSDRTVVDERLSSSFDRRLSMTSKADSDVLVMDQHKVLRRSPDAVELFDDGDKRRSNTAAVDVQILRQTPSSSPLSNNRNSSSRHGSFSSPTTNLHPATQVSTTAEKSNILADERLPSLKISSNYEERYPASRGVGALGPVNVYASSVTREPSSIGPERVERPDKLGPIRSTGGLFSFQSKSLSSPASGYVSGIGDSSRKLPPLRVTKRTPKALWNAAVRNLTGGSDLRWTAY